MPRRRPHAALRCAAFAEGVRLLADGAVDPYYGGIDDRQGLPAFLRREPPLRDTVGIVTRRDHPLQSARPTLGDLVRHR